MKKKIALLLVVLMLGAAFAACAQPAAAPEASAEPAAPAADASQTADTAQAANTDAAKPVELTVVTSYGGDDGNRGNYETAIAGYEAASGNKVLDASATSNEE